MKEEFQDQNNNEDMDDEKKSKKENRCPNSDLTSKVAVLNIIDVEEEIEFCHKTDDKNPEGSDNRSSVAVVSSSCSSAQERKLKLSDTLGTRSSKRLRDRPRFKKNKSSTKNENQIPSVPPVPKDVAMKNAVMMLNEMFPPPSAPQYKVTSMTGTPNNPTFTISCTLLDKTFVGTGKSKKEAKLSASQKVLEDMFGKDFTEGGGTGLSGENASGPKSLSEIDSWLELEGKNPVSILNELYPGVIFQLISAEGPSHAPQFCVRATLFSVSHDGRGTSKKEAKLNASKALLVHIHQVGFDPMTGNMKSNSGGQPDKEKAKEHSWADMIGNLVRDKFGEIFGGTTYSKRKVLAGVVMDQEGCKSVICVSSGTKCVNGEQICLGGSSLNDCHAEVVARRGLVFWMYEQLELALSDQESIFVKDVDGGYCVRSGITFHLFISTAPCGDARIFSLHEQADDGSNHLTGYAGSMGEGNRGKLRSKIESGMGTVPLPEKKSLQTWDGVMSGERLLTMACSDKILRWNVVGVQGSLLTHWVKPIYFSSVTIGSKFHPEHVRRAVYGRIGGVNHSLCLPMFYRLNQPPLLATTSPECRHASKAQEYTVNWVLGTSPEIVLGSTGKKTCGNPSRLCKMSFARKFLSLCQVQGAALRAKKSFSSFRGHVGGIRYSDLKFMAVDYNLAKDELVMKLKELGAGCWVEKPIEQDEFLMGQWRGPTIATWAWCYYYGTSQSPVVVCTAMVLSRILFNFVAFAAFLHKVKPLSTMKLMETLYSIL